MMIDPKKKKNLIKVQKKHKNFKIKTFWNFYLNLIRKQKCVALKVFCHKKKKIRKVFRLLFKVYLEKNKTRKMEIKV